MKRAGIFNPYWSTLGGGEKYTATVVKALLSQGYQVDLFWHDQLLPKQLMTRFGLEIGKAKIRPDLWTVFSQGNPIQRLMASQNYEVIFWVSDGSIPLLVAKNNLLHFQVPFHHLHQNRLLLKLKLGRIHHVVCNSVFTKKIIDSAYGCESQVVYPPATQIEPLPKRHLILSVGRFDNVLHAKRQDVLIDVFKDLHLPDWELILAGGSLSGSAEIEKLQQQIGTARIRLMVNPKHTDLIQLYGQASIYWHAAGFGTDLSAHPEKAEHFGISTVEAMSAGAVPVVFNGGGQPEIVTSGETGYLWNSLDELKQYTVQLIQSTSIAAMSLSCRQVAQKFNESAFFYAINQLLG